MGTLAPAFFVKNVTSVQDFIDYVNELSGGIFLPFLIAALWVIIYAQTVGTFGETKAFQYASFVTFVVTVIMVAIPTSDGGSLLDPAYLILPLIFLGISGYMLWKYKEY
jgi:hypothetical protein